MKTLPPVALGTWSWGTGFAGGDTVFGNHLSDTQMLPFWLQRLDDSLPLAATGLSRTLTRTFQEHVYVTPSYANTAALPVYLRVNGC